MISQLYTDGATIGCNPSIRGGSWAWVQVSREGERLQQRSGIVFPVDIGLPKVTNNLVELLAAIRGMQALPTGWSGTILTDSMVTMYRTELKKSKARMSGIPNVMIKLLEIEKRRLGRYSVRLLGGHPTKAELETGMRANHTPVSIHNVFVDQLCEQVIVHGLNNPRTSQEVIELKDLIGAPLPLVRCELCDKEVQRGKRLCTLCYHTVTRRCIKCGNPARKRHKYCRGCVRQHPRQPIGPLPPTPKAIHGLCATCKKLISPNCKYCEECREAHRLTQPGVSPDIKSYCRNCGRPSSTWIKCCLACKLKDQTPGS